MLATKQQALNGTTDRQSALIRCTIVGSYGKPLRPKFMLSHFNRSENP
jgi:hypothetical protein